MFLHTFQLILLFRLTIARTSLFLHSFVLDFSIELIISVQAQRVSNKSYPRHNFFTRILISKMTEAPLAKPCESFQFQFFKPYAHRIPVVVSSQIIAVAMSHTALVYVVRMRHSDTHDSN